MLLLLKRRSCKGDSFLFYFLLKFYFILLFCFIESGLAKAQKPTELILVAEKINSRYNANLSRINV